MLQPKGLAYNVVCLALHLLQIENYIVENMKSEMAQIQQNAVQNHTATMLEIGTSLLSQTAEQTRKLTDVETQVRRRPRDDKLLTGKISFFSFSLLHKHRAHFSTETGETYTSLFIGLITTVTAWHARHASLDFMRVDIFSFVCLQKQDWQST